MWTKIKIAVSFLFRLIQKSDNAKLRQENERLAQKYQQELKDRLTIQSALQTRNAMYLTAVSELRKANKGIHRLRKKLDRERQRNEELINCTCSELPIDFESYWLNKESE